MVRLVSPPRIIWPGRLLRRKARNAREHIMKYRLTACLLFACTALPVGCQALDQRRPAVDPAAEVDPAPAKPEIIRASARLLPPPEAGPEASALDLERALSLAGVNNPTIALALEAVAASQAAYLQAQVLAVPSLNAGASFNWHEGPLQSVQGIIRDLDRSSVYVGAGAFAVGAGTVGVPGVRIFAPLGDAVLEPVIARQGVAGRQLEAQATRNNVLLDVATAYFALAGAAARLQANTQSEAEFGEIARLTALHAEGGQGKQADADRAKTELLLIQSLGQQIQGELVAARAELARLLDLDPSLPLAPGPLPVLELVGVAQTPDALIEIALGNRPEIAARTADLVQAQTRVRQEQIRPLLPVLSVGFSGGGFGGGSNQVDPEFSALRGRTDFDVTAVWTLQNLGLGNLALQRRRRAEVGQVSAERALVVDQVRTDVTEAFALVAARRQEMELAQHRADAAARAYAADLRLAMNLGVRPIELLDSAKQLHAARQNYFTALAGFDQAQLQLFVALGQPPYLQP
jgi:outer membrane protein TolC